MHIHEKKTICGLMNADRRACWIAVDTAKLTGDRCHFVTRAHTRTHRCTQRHTSHTELLKHKNSKQKTVSGVEIRDSRL